jgi:alkylation response protein AidB-like acyl-CoA dehydrogenase
VIESYEDMGELGFVLDRLVDTVRAHESSGTSPEVLAGWRQRLADLWCRLQAVRFVQYDAVLALESGGTPPAESEIVKLVWSKVAQEASALGLEMCSALHGPPAPLVGTEEFWQWNYLNARSLTIYAGTSEIITCVIAERVLGLPRSR